MIFVNISIVYASDDCDTICPDGFKCFIGECIPESIKVVNLISRSKPDITESTVIHKVYNGKALFRVGSEYLSERAARTAGNFQFPFTSVLYTSSSLFISFTGPFFGDSDYRDIDNSVTFGCFAIVNTASGTFNLGARIKQLKTTYYLEGDPAIKLFKTSAFVFGASIATNSLYTITLLSANRTLKKTVGIINSAVVYSSCTLSFVTYFVNRKRLRNAVSKQKEKLETVSVEPLLRYENETIYANILLKY